MAALAQLGLAAVTTIDRWATSNSDHYRHYRAAAFDVTGRKTTETPSVILRFSHKTAWQESSNFYSDLRNASSSELTKYYCVNCCCSTVTMPIRSSSYTTWSTSELVVSVQLPLNTMFFCHAEVLSHMFFLAS